jgi:hypothetical protein
MAENPIIFALANPIPEILPEEAGCALSGAMIATGGSDYGKSLAMDRPRRLRLAAVDRPFHPSPTDP